MNLATPWRVLRHYLGHPLGRWDRIGTLMRSLRWQAGSRLLDAEVAMPFVDGPGCWRSASGPRGTSPSPAG